MGTLNSPDFGGRAQFAAMRYFWGDRMAKRTGFFLMTAVAVAVVLCSAGASLAATKKQTQAAPAGNPFRECCEKSGAQFYESGGKSHCLQQSERSYEAFQQCVYERGVRTQSIK